MSAAAAAAKSGYRADIDGLRAVAVLAVVWFGATVVDLSAAFCAHPRPWMLFTDRNHPSMTANREVIAPAMQRALAAVPAPLPSAGRFDPPRARPYQPAP